MNLLGNTLHKAKNNDLKVLTYPTHESAESILANCFPNITWYGLYADNVKTWNSTFRPCPPNYILLKNGIIPPELDIDVVISQTRFAHYQALLPIAKRYNIPMIQFEHTMTMPNWSKAQIYSLAQMRGDINLFITKSSQKAWGWDDTNSTVLEHCIDTEMFKPVVKERQPYVLTICNQFTKPVRFMPCGFPLWQQIMQPGTKHSLPFKHVGDQDLPLGKPAKNLAELVDEYNSAQVFLNTSQFSPIPMSLLEAASMGCACVSAATCEIPDIFKHGETALLSNNPQELRAFCIELLKNEPLRRKLGDNAREMIKERFNKEKYIGAWNQIWEKVRKI